MPSRLEKESIRRQWVKPKKKKKHRLLKACLFLGICAGLFFHFHTRHLRAVILEKFDAEKKWNIPSRVYSDEEYLYPGVSIAGRGLISKLERLGYRQTSDPIRAPGDFRMTPAALDIYLHDFAYPLEKFSGFSVRLELADGKISKLTDLESEETLQLVRLEPEEVATIFDEKMEDRTLITLKEVPSHLLEAILLIEDERFFKHHGVDPIAIARASLQNLLALRVVQGGSTLTQQLVKNYFLTADRTLWRKVNEAIMAILLERRYTKAQILEAYLNEIYLGQRGPSSVTGVAEASKHYFGKDVHQINLAEAALLAGLIRNPNEYSPFKNKVRSKARRDFVLKKMLERELIDEEHYQLAYAETIMTPKAKIKPVFAPFFIDFVKWQLADLYPQEILEAEGLKIFTTLDMHWQLAAEEVATQGLKELEKRWISLFSKDHAGLLETCLIAMTPQNGYVRAMVGGKDYTASQFNRCTQAKRQPGSVFKPFVYLTALDKNRSGRDFTLASLLEDKSFTIDTPQGPWSPENYDKKEHGLVSLRTALEQSYNIATARLALDVGLEAIATTAKDAGIQSPLQPVPSMALGSSEVTPLEMASAYNIFPNQGLKVDPLAIIHVMTTEGKILERKTLKIHRLFDAVPVALTTTLLKGVLDRGTAVSARTLGFQAPAAGKTGTTSSYRDAWFVGFNPNLLSLVWVGYDDNTPIQMSGARAALPMWTQFMKQVTGVQAPDFHWPGELILVKIDPESGRLPTKQCPRTIFEYFAQGTEPEEPCPLHGKGVHVAKPVQEEF